MITVKVGEVGHQREFNLHKGLLEHYSAYFGSALQSHWAEGSAKVVNLSDDSPEIFQVFFHWLYSRKLYHELTTEGQIPLSFKTILDIYIFGDARIVPELSNAAMNLFAQKLIRESCYPVDCVIEAYQNTRSGSGMRKFLAHIAATCFSWSLDNDCLSALPKDFLVDILLLLQKHECVIGQKFTLHGTIEEDIKSTICDYHDHSDPHTCRNH